METITITVKDYEAVSDGYHTIGELYDHRITLWIALCKRLQGVSGLVWRAKKHFDGTNYEGWFILGYRMAKGDQITYHIPIDRWEETNFAETYDKAQTEFDGHSSKDVLDRISKL